MTIIIPFHDHNFPRDTLGRQGKVLIRAIQVDGGSEFRAAFESACRDLGIRLFVLPPRSPKLNGHVERAQRTHTEEFYELYEGELEMAPLNCALQKWERLYDTYRPHQPLDGRTPAECSEQCHCRTCTERVQWYDSQVSPASWDSPKGRYVNIRLLAAGALALFLVAGCGPGDDPEIVPASGATPASSGSVAAATPTPASAEPTPEKLEGRIAFSSERIAPDGSTVRGDIYVINPDGSGLTQVTTHEDADFLPEWSPDGSRIAFTSARHSNPHNAGGSGEIYLIDPNGSNETRVTDNTSFDRFTSWSSDGKRLLFLSSRDSRSGSFMWSTIYVMNVDGTDQTRVDIEFDTRAQRWSVTSADWSPDGDRIALSILEGFRDGRWVEHIYVMDADSDVPTPLTQGDGNYRNPEWSPDGSRIVFNARYWEGAGSVSAIMVMDADGSNMKRLTDGKDYAFDPTWSPDGRGIAFTANTSETIHPNIDIFVMYADGSGLTRLTDNPGNDGSPVWGPPAGG